MLIFNYGCLEVVIPLEAICINCCMVVKCLVQLSREIWPIICNDFAQAWSKKVVVARKLVSKSHCERVRAS